MAKKILGLSMTDDVSAVSKKTADSLDVLRSRVKVLGDAFKAQNVGALTVKLKDAKRLFKETGQNAVLFKEALKVAGVSALDSSLLIGKVTEELKRNRRAALGMEGILQKVFNPKTIWVASHALNVMSKGYGALSAVAGGAYGVASAAGGFALDKGKDFLDTMIQAASFREDTLTALREVAGGGEKGDKEAQDLYKFAVKSASQTPLDTDYIIEKVKELRTAGFSAEGTKRLLGVIADQQAKFGGETGNFAAGAMGRIRGRTFATTEDFDALRTARFPMEDIYKELAGPLGVKEKDPMKQVAAVRKQLSHAGGVGSYDLINAMMRAVEGKGGIAGSFSLKSSDSLTGALSNIKSSFGDLLKMDDMLKWDGIVELKKFLVMVTGEMTNMQGAGGLLLTGVRALTDSILGGLRNITKEDVAGFLKRAGEFALGVADAVKAAWGWLAKLKESDDGFLDTLGDTLLEVGAYIGAGIWKGVKGGVTAITEDKYTRKFGTKGMSDVFDYQASLYGTNKKKVAEDFGQSYSAFKKAGGKVEPWAGEDQAAATWRVVQDWQKTQSINSAAKEAGQAGSALAGELLAWFRGGSAVPRPAGREAGAGSALAGTPAAGAEGKQLVQVVNNMTFTGDAAKDPHSIKDVVGPGVGRSVVVALQRLGRE